MYASYVLRSFSGTFKDKMEITAETQSTLRFMREGTENSFILCVLRVSAVRNLTVHIFHMGGKG